LHGTVAAASQSYHIALVIAVMSWWSWQSCHRHVMSQWLCGMVVVAAVASHSCDVTMVRWHGSGSGGHIILCCCGSSHVVAVVMYLGCCCCSCGVVVMRWVVWVVEMRMTRWAAQVAAIRIVRWHV
jgi:hypothetical protein